MTGMEKYWESRFRDEGAMWKFEPSDSALRALSIFKLNRISNILIPGIGYGRNAKLFLDNGFKVTGIEIAGSAIELAETSGLRCKIFNGSVTSMPYDDVVYDGVFCYALLHLLNKRERRTFLKSCFSQLKPGGLMIFTVISREANMYGKGRLLSTDRFRMENGLSVYFYDSDSVQYEFRDFGMIESGNIDEPIKFMEGQESLKCKFIVCKK